MWHILLDSDMKKKDLEATAGLSHYAMNKMSRDENESTEVLGKVCLEYSINRRDFFSMI
ncbi:helix-turn-helix domain-containing protein [Atopobacter sp. AH10]|uniref:helix-turn-helix domain-containing protein n=1 Tax=Atopobacter sp. AH10 TaxID=2315861 RepID=UPI003519ECA4